MSDSTKKWISGKWKMPPAGYAAEVKVPCIGDESDDPIVQGCKKALELTLRFVTNDQRDLLLNLPAENAAAVHRMLSAISKTGECIGDQEFDEWLKDKGIPANSAAQVEAFALVGIIKGGPTQG